MASNPFAPPNIVGPIIGAIATAAVALGSAAIGSSNHNAERIATLEQDSRTTAARLDRIEQKIDRLIERR